MIPQAFLPLVIIHPSENVKSMLESGEASNNSSEVVNYLKLELSPLHKLDLK